MNIDKVFEYAIDCLEGEPCRYVRTEWTGIEYNIYVNEYKVLEMDQKFIRVRINPDRQLTSRRVLECILSTFSFGHSIVRKSKGTNYLLWNKVGRIPLSVHGNWQQVVNLSGNPERTNLTEGK